MTRWLRRLLLRILLALRFDRLHQSWQALMADLKVLSYRRRGVELRFVPQGGFDFEIMGDLSRFRIATTSHLKSDTYIETSGGVSIGQYFHPGRGLTIFSTNHDYQHGTRIPYDETSLEEPVAIGDFVWCGANVTILPGVRVGEGAVLAGGCVVSADVPPLAIVAGNPARVVKYREAKRFNELKSLGRFY